MNTPIGTIPRLSIGRHTDQVASRLARYDFEVTNVAVRTADRDAFLAIIATREAQILNSGDPARSMAGKALEASTSMQAATEALTTDCPPDLAIAHMETAAAIAIGLLAELKGKN